MQLLKTEGFEVTQSSVSRDLRDLGVLKASGRYVLPPDEVSRANGDFAMLAQFVRGLRRAGPSLTVLQDHHRRGAERRRRHRQGGVARGRRHHLRRRHHLHRHRRRARAGRSSSRGCRPSSESETMHQPPSSEGRPAHRPRLFRRPRHLVPGALARGEPRPPRHHRDRRHRRHRRGRCAHAWPSAPARSGPSSIIRSMRARTTSSRCCAFSSWETCRRGQLYPLCVGAERVMQAQTIAHMARKLGTNIDRPRLHRRGQRPGALRGRAAHAGAGARGARAGARPAPSSARRSSTTCSSADCRCRPSAPPTRSTAACGASRSEARRR